MGATYWYLLVFRTYPTNPNLLPWTRHRQWMNNCYFYETAPWSAVLLTSSFVGICPEGLYKAYNKLARGWSGAPESGWSIYAARPWIDIWHMHPKDATRKNELPIDIARGIGFHKEKTYSEMRNEMSDRLSLMHLIDSVCYSINAGLFCIIFVQRLRIFEEDLHLGI